MIQPHTYEK